MHEGGVAWLGTEEASLDSEASAQLEYMEYVCALFWFWRISNNYDLFLRLMQCQEI